MILGLSGLTCFRNLGVLMRLAKQEKMGLNKEIGIEGQEG